MSKSLPKHHFYGTTTIGAKGQVVIPAEARKQLNIASGDKLLVFGMGKDMLAMATLPQLEAVASHLSEKLEMIQNAIQHPETE